MLYLAILLTIPVLAFASPAEEIPERSVPILDTVQELFGSRANFAANRLDSFFATDRADDEFGRSRIRIRSIYNIGERVSGDLNNQYRINLKLPHLEEKFRYRFFDEKKEEDKKKLDEAVSKEEKPISDKDILGKLRRGWIFNSDISVSAAIPPRFTTRARVRNNFQTGNLIHRFTEQFTYVTDERGLIEETRLESDQAFDENLLFRFINYKRWRILDKNIDTQHGPTLLHRLTDDDAFNYGFIGSFLHTNSVTYFNNYRLSVNYRRNLYKQWLYLDVIPGIDWPKKWSFRRTPFVLFQLEFLFGGT